MNALEFQRKWLANTQKERSASQPHFLDLCALVGHPTPSEMDPAGEVFAFEKAPASFAVARVGPMSGTGVTSRSNTRGWARTSTRRMIS